MVDGCAQKRIRKKVVDAVELERCKADRQTTCQRTRAQTFLCSVTNNSNHPWCWPPSLNDPSSWAALQVAALVG